MEIDSSDFDLTCASADQDGLCAKFVGTSPVAILAGSNNPVFGLARAALISTRSRFDVRARRTAVLLRLHDSRPETATETLPWLSDGLVEDVFDAIDQEFFGGAIGKTMRERHRRTINCVAVESTGKPGQLGRFTRRGDVHTITIAESVLVSLFGEDRVADVCGIQCGSWLEALVCTVEHEIAHLLAFSNWIECEPHGPEFASVAYCFFRHTRDAYGPVLRRTRNSETAAVVDSS